MNILFMLAIIILAAIELALIFNNGFLRCMRTDDSI